LGKAFIAEKFVRALINETSDRPLELHPDVVQFLPEEGKKDISVEQVRKNRLRLYERPQFASRIVAFLPKLDRLNSAGYNALLKVMEEPPVDAVFVSVAENLSQIPDTILSRTVRVPMRLVSQTTIQAGLQARGMPADEAQERAAASRGRPGLALCPEDEGAAFVRILEQYVKGPEVGHRLAAADGLRQACESESDPAATWLRALQSGTEILRKVFASEPRRSMILAQGLVDAMAAVNSAVSPHLMLQAAALQASRDRLNLPNIYPRYFPLSLVL
jgi:hypothetical protein